MRKELGQHENERGIYTGTFAQFGQKSGWKHSETTFLLVKVKNDKHEQVTDHLWFNYVKEMRELYDQGQLKPGTILEFQARVRVYVKGYEKNEYDYKLSHPTKFRIVGSDPEWVGEYNDIPLDVKLEIDEIKKTGTLGTKEWADENVNLQKGCEHGCLYCYAMKMAFRFKRAKSYDEWIEPELSDKTTKAIHNYQHTEKRFMYPSSHDITLNNLALSQNLISRLLGAKIRILIVSKPHLDCMKEIIDYIEKWVQNDVIIPKELIEFRFTITAATQEQLNLWEPHAPNFTERLESLKYCFEKGYATSVSIEPYLEDPINVINAVKLFVTNTIWVGVMNTIHLTKIAWPLFESQNLAAIYTKDYVQHHLPDWQAAAGVKLRIKDSIQHLLQIPQLNEVTPMALPKPEPKIEIPQAKKNPKVLMTLDEFFMQMKSKK